MAANVATEDPYLWLEEVESERSLEFAKSANAKCLEALGDPTKGPSYDRILAVLESKDRLPHVSSFGKDPQGEQILFNFWKDGNNPKGIWRKTSMSEFKKTDPKWEVVLDVDALAEKDNISWVWKGSRSLPRRRDPESVGAATRCLTYLSRGGSDAIFLKEFDLTTNQFVTESPFELPEAKTRACYKSRDCLLVGSAFDDKSLTDSGYPRTVREWERGTSIDDAPTIFEGEATDVAVNGYIADERNWGGKVYQVHSRSITFYTSSYEVAELSPDHLLPPSQRPKDLAPLEFRRLEIPDDADIDFLGKLFLLSLRTDWTPNEATGKTFKSGSILYGSFDTLLKQGKAAVDYQILFEPTERTAYEYFTCTKNYLVLATMENVQSKLEFYKLTGGDTLTLVSGDSKPQIRDCNVRPIDPENSDEFWFTTSSFTQPSSLYLADAARQEAQSADATETSMDPFIVEQLKTLPPQYNSEGIIVEQRTATSADGTEIPYFIVMKKDTELKGKNPTLLYGYGGFEVSLGPHYIATSGLAWLERGGVYVEANIRGGGEFGPKWHQAALKENRIKAYEDFIAVGEHLTQSGICEPSTLAIRGGSNGGLLMGMMYTMRPDLFGAIHCAVPLLDMKRFHLLLAGASWMAEYGNPDTEDWDKFLHRYSPYHHIDASCKSYPPLLVTTSTRDDRVHPAHARKFVQKLWDMGDWPVYYYENIEGGHGGAANAKQSSFMTSLAYDFMWETLTKNASK